MGLLLLDFFQLSLLALLMAGFLDEASRSSFVSYTLKVKKKILLLRFKVVLSASANSGLIAINIFWFSSSFCLRAIFAESIMACVPSVSKVITTSETHLLSIRCQSDSSGKYLSKRG
jgi:hypothetical protein